jgi:hypothetical protein
MVSLCSTRGLTHSLYTSAGDRLTTLNGTVIAPLMLASRRALSLLGCRSSQTYAPLAYSLPEDLGSASAISYRWRLLVGLVSSLKSLAGSRGVACRCLLGPLARSYRALVGIVSSLMSLARSRGVACHSK